MSTAKFEPYGGGSQENASLLESDFEESCEFGNYRLGNLALYIAARDGKWLYVLRENLQGAHFAHHDSVRISCRRSKEMPGIAVDTHDSVRVGFSFVFESELDEFIRIFDLVEDRSIECAVAPGAPAHPAAPGKAS